MSISEAINSFSTRQLMRITDGNGQNPFLASFPVKLTTLAFDNNVLDSMERQLYAACEAMTIRHAMAGRLVPLHLALFISSAFF